jgi:hypothetical protein
MTCRYTAAAEITKIMARLNFVSTYAFSKLLTEQLVGDPHNPARRGKSDHQAVTHLPHGWRALPWVSIRDNLQEYVWCGRQLYALPSCKLFAAMAGSCSCCLLEAA